ncbi:hypothetical protein RU639_010547 [Aspergillus parasiticus]
MMLPWHLFCILLLFTRHVFSAEKLEKPLQDIPENKYSICEEAPSDEELNFCLEKDYMAVIEQQFRDAGIVMPFVNNDAIALDNWAPETGKEVLIFIDLTITPLNRATDASPENWTQIIDPLTHSEEVRQIHKVARALIFAPRW